MFDFGFSELVLIGAVALVVLGPEKLPVVARTAGEWLGKAQRMVQQVKNDIEREAELAELKKIQEEAKGIADDLTNTVKGQMNAIESDVKSLQSDVNSAAKEMTEGFESAKNSFEDFGKGFGDINTPGEEMASAFDKKPFESNANALSAEADEKIAENVNDFYDWYGAEEPYTSDEESVKTTFDRRYKCGPSVDEIAEQLERVKADVGTRAPQLGGYNRKYAVRARSNRVRIYR